MSSRMFRPVGSTDTKVRAQRLVPRGDLIVESQTLGVPLAYRMPLANVSRSGLLIGAGQNRKIPFQLNTLLELRIDPWTAVFERPVQCLGKVVRVAPASEGTPLFGVQIIQMETKDLAVWEKGFVELEANTGGAGALTAASG